MKEVVRIHIASTAYDIEPEARKELEKYLKALEAYSRGTDILEDVEVRITEILAERGIKKDQVVSLKDVKSLKGQLGDPHEFMTYDQEEAVIETEDIAIGTSERKLFRDTDHALLGGVLSGIAAFFGVQVVLVRIIFIILFLASFGTAVLLYVILWAVVPPARTAADRLQMQGRAVTIASIREINEIVNVRPASDDVESRRVLLTLSGIVCVIGAAGAAFVTVVVSLGAFLNRNRLFADHGSMSRWLVLALICAAISGLLLSSLFSLLAYASFARKMTKRIVISICTVICLGFVSFSSAVAITQYVVFKSRNDISTSEQQAAIPMSQPTYLIMRK